MNKNSKIIRTWKGWTTKANAKTYEKLLINKIFPDVKRKEVKGLTKVSIFTQMKADEVEFFLTLEFDSIEDVKSFAGENYKAAYMPEEAKKVLKRYDEFAQHYEFKEDFFFKYLAIKSILF